MRLRTGRVGERERPRSRGRGGTHRANVFALCAHTLVGLLLTVLIFLVVTPAASATAVPAVSPAPLPAIPRVIVKYRATGPHALEACAEALDRSGAEFASSTADRNPRLDRLRERLGLRRHRALFRTAPGGDLGARRDRLQRRIDLARAKRASMDPRGKSRRSPPSRTRDLPDLAHIYRVELAAAQTPEAAVRALRADPAVEWAQIDGLVVPDQAAPFDDPVLSSADGWGQGFADLWGLYRIRAPKAWETALGDGTVIAIVDTGLDYAHPDIADNLWVNPGEDLDGDGRFLDADRNGIDDDGNGLIDDGIGFDFSDSIDADEDGRYDGPEDVNDADPFDVRGHGTHVAGTAAAIADNGEGIVGVAPGARVMALKGFPAEGSGRDSDLWRAVLSAAAQGADVVNNSWSCGRPCPVNPLARDVLAVVEALGTTVVTSAGNRAEDVASYAPENGDGVLTVGSIGFDDRISAFSNFGWGIDVVAPGGGPTTAGSVRAPRRNILSLLPLAGVPDEEPFVVGERYRRLAGTSMSAPHVAGAVALLRSLHPDLTPAEIRGTIRVSTREIGAPGPDSRYGTGALDLARLVTEPPVRASILWPEPAPGQFVDPAEGALRFEVYAIGEGVATLEIALARGLAGRPFEEIGEVAGGSVEFAQVADGLRAQVTWDPTTHDDGPHVLRARMALEDGRILDTYRVVAIERVHAGDRSDGLHAVGAPALAGPRVVWPIASELEPAADFDLAVAPFAGGSPRAVAKPRDGDRPTEAPLEEDEPFVRFDVTGIPVDVVADGRLVAWRARRDTRFEIAWCVLPQGNVRALTPADCREQIIDTGDDSPARPQVGRGWIVWERQAATGRTIQGCPVARSGRAPGCEPRPLVASSDDVGSAWRLLHFDGERLLLRSGATLAFCTPARDGSLCEPVPIETAPGTPVVSEAVHDGDLLVLFETGVASQPPLGCLPGEFDRDCLPDFAVTQRLWACRIDSEDAVCAPSAITDAIRLERFGGVRVSEGRIAWAEAAPLEETAILVCRFDAETKTCPPQRLTGAFGRQDMPDLDGERVAWRGAREAAPTIRVHRLPALRLPEKTRIRAGRAFTISGRASSGTARRLDYSVTVLGEAVTSGTERSRPPRHRFRRRGDSGEGSWQLRVETSGRGRDRLRLVGRAPRSAAGEVALRVHATTEEGVSTYQDVRVEIVDPPNVSGGSRPRGFLGLLRWWRDVLSAYTPGR